MSENSVKIKAKACKDTKKLSIRRTQKIYGLYKLHFELVKNIDEFWISRKSKLNHFLKFQKKLKDS